MPPPETETGAAADMIGQGTVLASPFAMATVAASVAAGRAVLPVLLPEHEVEQMAPEVPLTAAEAGTLRGLMRAVVTTGSGRFLLDVPGEIGAKTGTAEYGEPDASGALPDPRLDDRHPRRPGRRGVRRDRACPARRPPGPVLEAFLR